MELQGIAVDLQSRVQWAYSSADLQGRVQWTYRVEFNGLTGQSSMDLHGRVQWT